MWCTIQPRSFIVGSLLVRSFPIATCHVNQINFTCVFILAIRGYRGLCISHTLINLCILKRKPPFRTLLFEPRKKVSMNIHAIFVKVILLCFAFDHILVNLVDSIQISEQKYINAWVRLTNKIHLLLEVT